MFLFDKNSKCEQNCLYTMSLKNINSAPKELKIEEQEVVEKSTKSIILNVSIAIIFIQFWTYNWSLFNKV